MKEDCQDVVSLVAARRLGLLDVAEDARLAAHLAAGCEECGALARDVDEALEGAACPPVAAPLAARQKFLDRVREDRARGALPAVTVLLACTYCHGALARKDASFCAGCLAPCHEDCFSLHGRCSAPGCGETRLVRPQAPRPRPSRVGMGVLVLGVVLGGGAVAALTALATKGHDDDAKLASNVRRVIEALTPGFGQAKEIIARKDEAHYRDAEQLLQAIPDSSPLQGEARTLRAWLRQQREVADCMVRADEARAGGDLLGEGKCLEDAIASLDTGASPALQARLAALEQSPDYRATVLCGKAQGLEQGWDEQGRSRPADLDAARAVYTKAIEIAPRFEPAWRERAELETNRERYEPALRDLARAVELDPCDETAWHDRSYVHEMQGDLAGAIAELDRGVAFVKTGTATQLWGWRSEAKRAAKDLEGAIADANRAIELYRDGASWRLRALAHKEGGDFKGALADLDQAIKVKDEAESRLERADVFLRMGDLPAARRELAAAIDLAASFDGNNLAYVADVMKRVRDLSGDHFDRPVVLACLAGRSVALKEHEDRLVSFFEAALAEPDHEVRVRAVLVLLGSQGRLVYAALERALTNEDESVRFLAAGLDEVALRSDCREDAVKALTALRDRKEESYWVRLRAAVALFELAGLPRSALAETLRQELPARPLDPGHGKAIAPEIEEWLKQNRERLGPGF